MPLNTVALGVALTPAVISTFISHYLHRKSLHHKPSIHIGYDEGIHIFREFLAFSAKHSVEDLQSFTSQKVPSPHWVRTETVTIPTQYLSSAATALIDQLGPKGLSQVGGKEWWQWRGPVDELKGEWVEMRNDYNERMQARKIHGTHPSQKRIMFYVHGGAYYFGSLETHRYQMQRHARKLKGRVFARTFVAAAYRLAPQFPFPCALHDCLAAYLFLLKEHKPEEIIFAGDSAGGGMALALLCILRDQGLPLPAGAILISPWVDLTHSFPSIVKDNPGDYIPPYGFKHKPSAAWPPPNSDEIDAIKKGLGKQPATENSTKEAIPPNGSEAQETAVKGYSVHENPSVKESMNATDEPGNPRVLIDGKTVEIKDQIQMYTTNQLIFHPLVSPVLQPSLGGLPPLQILSGGGEKLRDEQFYVAHKAANPTAYPPNDAFLDEYDPERETLHKYPGTHVQLQVWDDLCHVPTTLSFTRPAKYMFRSIAQFGAWALACAQETEIDIVDDIDISPISSDSSEDPDTPANGPQAKSSKQSVASVGKAGDRLPPFKERMIRQRVDKRGHIYHLEPQASCPVLQIPSSQVGAINPELVKNWLAEKNEWDVKYAKDKLHVQRQRVKELAQCFQQDFVGEVPPPSSLAARRSAPGVMPSRGDRKSYPMTMWSNWASRHDEKSIQREHKKEKEGQSKKTAWRLDVSHAYQIAITVDANEHIQDTSDGTKSSATRTEEDVSHRLIDKSSGPMILLPPYDEKKFTEENASTQALFHARGTITSTSDLSMARKQRPVSQAGSGTIRSGITSHIADDTSTLGDRSLAVTNAGVDAASTRAVRNSVGVVGLINDGDSTYHSIDFHSIPRDSGDLDTASLGGRTTEGDLSRTASRPVSRPGMADREFYKTAQEHPVARDT
ncbi:lipase/esterase family protein [Aspergillus nomiae NRRL 13137]|uniref:Lipase/esterase family protein n=1 Tax=Aspergillus nomiae NRRL (strain ATCC 15546 / NRRL 13137 / CBS 260.88 / M93) TaxID=1509407 RepID=A0A0L1J0P7_ASPN3|nr:lipase/esterase family protein [Aspergillus nomiae NRRL 13137]KNG85381.1 lipase/esterase family protein [Aspergillus nomiae NRRL 13137]